MSVIVSHISDISTAYSTVCSGSHKEKHQSSASLASVRGIHRWPVDSPRKGPVTRKKFLFYDIISHYLLQKSHLLSLINCKIAKTYWKHSDSCSCKITEWNLVPISAYIAKHDNFIDRCVSTSLVVVHCIWVESQTATILRYIQSGYFFQTAFSMHFSDKNGCISFHILLMFLLSN